MLGILILLVVLLSADGFVFHRSFQSSPVLHPVSSTVQLPITTKATLRSPTWMSLSKIPVVYTDRETSADNRTVNIIKELENLNILLGEYFNLIKTKLDLERDNPLTLVGKLRLIPSSAWKAVGSAGLRCFLLDKLLEVKDSLPSLLGCYLVWEHHWSIKRWVVAFRALLLFANLVTGLSPQSHFDVSEFKSFLSSLVFSFLRNRSLLFRR